MARDDRQDGSNAGLSKLAEAGEPLDSVGGRYGGWVGLGATPPSLSAPTTDFSYVAPDDIGGRVRAVWEVVEVVIEQAVAAAEVVLSGSKTGQQKRDYAKIAVLEALDDLEGRYDLIPGWIEPIAFRAFSLAVGIAIDRVVGEKNAAATK